VERVEAGGRQVASLVSLSCLTGLRPKVIAQKDALDGPGESINVSFNFIGIFRPRCNLDMQFSELHS